MRGRGDPAWKRYYDVIDRVSLLLQEGQITGRRYEAVHEAARRRAYRDQTPRDPRRASRAPVSRS